MSELKNLVPLKNPYEYDNVIALDIETASDGSLLDIGLYTGGAYHTVDSWHKCLKILFKLTGDWRVCAHNGFGFDYIGLIQYLADNLGKYGIEDKDVTFLSSEALLISVIIRKQNLKLTFIDTTRFFPGMSLEKLGQSMFGIGKHDVPDDMKSKMELFKKQFPSRYFAYLKQDCELLYNVYTIFRDKVNEFVNIGELGLSSGSTSMRAFRRWLHSDNADMMIFSAPKEYMGAAEECLRGGLTLYIGDGAQEKLHHYPSVNAYDVISMYPSIQRYIPVPTSPMSGVSDIVVDMDGRVRPGWYLVKFEQLKGRVPILHDIDRKIDHPVWEGTGLLSYFEIEFLRKYGKIHEVYDGIVYNDYAYPFADFMNEGLNRRLDAKAKKEDALVLAIKILLNSLYGKFAQSPTIEQVAISSNIDWYDSMLEAELHAYNETRVIEYYYNNGVVLYGVPSESTGFSNRFIGGMITSLARLKLGMVYNTVHPIYCDTDSIFTQDELHSSFLGNKAGCFEVKALNQNMICLGKKSYQYGDDITWKGIPKKALTSQDIELLSGGESKRVEYTSPTAFKTAMRQKIKRPNEFLGRHRTVKAAKSLRMRNLVKEKNSLFSAKNVQSFLDIFIG
jgi:hypothetical protein